MYSRYNKIVLVCAEHRIRVVADGRVEAAGGNVLLGAADGDPRRWLAMAASLLRLLAHTDELRHHHGLILDDLGQHILDLFDIVLGQGRHFF
jgi:hypothetical protein